MRGTTVTTNCSLFNSYSQALTDNSPASSLSRVYHQVRSNHLEHYELSSLQHGPAVNLGPSAAIREYSHPRAYRGRRRRLSVNSRSGHEFYRGRNTQRESS